MEKNNDNKKKSEIISIRGMRKINLPNNLFEFIPQKEGKPS